MKKLGLILATFWFLTNPVAKAGELDSEYGSRAKVVTPAPSMGQASGELDAESPDQAWFHGRRFFGYGVRGYGYGFGFYRGFYGYPRYYGGFGIGRGFGFGRRW